MTEKDKALSLFEELKQKRIDQKLDLADIAKESKIQLKYLEAIEAGRLEDIPHIYDKFFFQTYLSFLDVENPEQIMAEFREYRKSKRPQYTTTMRRLKTADIDPRRASLLSKFYIIIPLVVLVVIIIILAINSVGVESNSEANIKELPIRDIVEQLESRADSLTHTVETETTKFAVSPSAKATVTIILEAVERTWLRTVEDRADTSEYLMQTGERLTLDADSTMEFLIGNAAGLQFTVNDNNLGILGGEGEVISYLKINAGGVVQKRLKKVKRETTINDTFNNN